MISIKNYYYQILKNYFKYYVIPNSSILQLGEENGVILEYLEASSGVIIKKSKDIINSYKKKFPDYSFINIDINKDKLNIKNKFDYIIISDVIRDIEDIQYFFNKISNLCNKNTRIIISYSNKFWGPIFKLAELLKIKKKEVKQNWVDSESLKNIIKLSNFEIIKENKKIILPIYLPIFNYFFNNILSNLPIFRNLCLLNFVHLRYKFKERVSHKKVSIIIPTKNERGNIENAIKRIPKFGKSQEIIFVDGNSKDNTYEEILKNIKKYKNLNIKLFKQVGSGKGDAVRCGFKNAKGDILMILDADLTVPPEELVKFYDAVIFNHGEFINGSRFVYPMEKNAMRFLNMIGNKFFTNFLSYSINQTLTDTLCGTKVLLKKDYIKIEENRKFFGNFDPFGDFDLIFGASRLNLKIIDIPIRYQERTYGTTQISRFYHGWLLIKMSFYALIKIKLI